MTKHHEIGKAKTDPVQERDPGDRRVAGKRKPRYVRAEGSISEPG